MIKYTSRKIVKSIKTEKIINFAEIFKVEDYD